MAKATHVITGLVGYSDIVGDAADISRLHNGGIVSLWSVTAFLFFMTGSGKLFSWNRGLLKRKGREPLL